MAHRCLCSFCSGWDRDAVLLAAGSFAEDSQLLEGKRQREVVAPESSAMERRAVARVAHLFSEAEQALSRGPASGLQSDTKALQVPADRYRRWGWNSQLWPALNHTFHSTCGSLDWYGRISRNAYRANTSG